MNKYKQKLELYRDNTHTLHTITNAQPRVASLPVSAASAVLEGPRVDRIHSPAHVTTAHEGGVR